MEATIGVPPNAASQDEAPDEDTNDLHDDTNVDGNEAVEDKVEVDFTKMTGKQKKLFELRLKMVSIPSKNLLETYFLLCLIIGTHTHTLCYYVNSSFFLKSFSPWSLVSE